MDEQVVCPQCGRIEPSYWRDQEVNPSILEHVRAYIPPVRGYHLTLQDALEEWGSKIQPEDLLL